MRVAKTTRPAAPPRGLNASNMSRASLTPDIEAAASSSQGPRPRATVSTTQRDKEVLALVERGEENLLYDDASTAYKLRTQRNNRGRIELGVSELSHLHAQLNSMTTQCTLIVGFALAGLGADTLTQLGSMTTEFCIYKTLRARLLGSLFITCTTLCIFFSMTVIACAQTIACESNVRIFDYDNTHHVVLMTNILMHGDRRAAKVPVRRCVVISHLFNLALFSFFAGAILSIWIFLGTNNWVEFTKGHGPGGTVDGIVQEPPNGTAWNPYLIYTDRGKYYMMCANPYDQEESQRLDQLGTDLAFAVTGIFFFCSIVFVLTRKYVEKMYRPESLMELGNEMAMPLHH